MHLRDRAVIGILSLALVGLTGAVVAPSLQTEAPASTPVPTVSVNHPYVEGIVGSATTVSPFSASTIPEREIASLLFRGLVRLGPDDKLIGDLAESWDVDQSGASWTFHLRPGLVWQDGEPITAQDVLFTIGALSNPTYTGVDAASWREVTATASDPLTVTLTLATPLGGFLQAATQPIAPEHLLAGVAAADLATDPFGQHPVGSGSFRLLSLDTEHAVLVPSVADAPTTDGGGPNASAPAPTDSLATAAPPPPGGIPLPYLNGIEFRFYPSDAALETAWQAGTLDGAAGVPSDTANQLLGGGGARVIRYPSTTLLGVTLNLRPSHPEFRDPAVRRALLQAINRDAIVASVLGGYASRADTLIPPSSWAFDAAVSPTVPFDANAAAVALTKAGWKRGTDGTWTPKGATGPLTIELLSPEAAANPKAYGVAEAVAADWRAIGLTVVHTALPASELVGQRLHSGTFDAAVVPTTIGLDPDLYPLLASTQATTTGSNFGGVQDASLDALLVRARAPGTEADRIAAYAALQAKLVAGTYMLPVAFPNLLVVVRNTLSGPESRPVGAPGDRFWDVLTWRLADGR
jgi:peptide/nickel transport system substrate-binding protein